MTCRCDGVCRRQGALRRRPGLGRAPGRGRYSRPRYSRARDSRFGTLTWRMALPHPREIGRLRGDAARRLGRIDVYFDNVPASISRPRWERFAGGGASRSAGRSPGTRDGADSGTRQLFQATANDLTRRGFRGSSYVDHMADMQREVGGWLRNGRLRYRESIVEGLDRAPRGAREPVRRDDRQDAGTSSVSRTTPTSATSSTRGR